MTGAATAKQKIGMNMTALLLSAAINLLLFFLLSKMNNADLIYTDPTLNAGISFTLVQQAELREPETALPENPVTEPEIMTVDLDRIEVKPVQLDPIILDLSVPILSERPLIIEPIVSDARSHSRPSSSNSKEHDRVKSANQVDEPPRELAAIDPEYPEAALSNNSEGWVMAKLLINECGVVEDIQILQVKGHPSFRKAVLDAARNWKFKPARHGGTLVKVWGIKRIRFELEDA